MLDMPLKIKKRIDQLMQKRDELDALKGRTLGSRVQSSQKADTTGEIATKIADIDTEIHELRKTYLIAIGKLSGYLYSLDAELAEIMRLRYIEGQSTYRIAIKVGLDRSTVSKKINKERKRLGL